MDVSLEKYDEESDLEIKLGESLKGKGLTISSAESCTGGRIASLFAKHAGSSMFFKGSVVAYCNEVKEHVLGVDRQTLDTFGAVSRETVEQMVKGVCRLMKTDIGVATSGVAGPGGGSPETPVGTIWLGVGTKEEVITRKLSLTDNRECNIQMATNLAIFLAKEFVQKNF